MDSRGTEGNWLDPIILTIPQNTVQNISQQPTHPPTLAQTLAETIPVFSRLPEPLTQVNQWFAEKRFYTLAGIPLNGNEVGENHQTLLFHRPVADLHLVPAINQPNGRLKILWENPVAAIINKPGNLATMPRGRYIARSVVWQARRQWDNAQIVAAHRLDRLTSGCLLLIKHPDWRRAYQQLFDQRKIQKTYQAWTCSPASPPAVGTEYIWQAELSRTPGKLSANLHLLNDISEKNTTPSTNEKTTTTITRAKILGYQPKLGFLYWQLQPKTGFFHQLRVVLSGAGYPIVGDPLYPTENLKSLADPQTQLALRATQISFPDPYTNQIITVNAPDLPAPK